MYSITCLLLAFFASAADKHDHDKRARAFLELLVKEDFKGASKDFDATMKEKMPVEELDKIWKTIGKQIGAFKKVANSKTTKVGTSNVVDLTCEFAKASVVFRVSFDKDEKVQGFFLRPAKPLKFDPPPYAKADSYREEKVVIGEKGEWPLKGTLTLPKGKGPFPAVVLIQGSGPHDQDETIGPNKPFRDLAWGLATQGIAVLRFEKRTFAHGAKFVKNKDAITIKEEVEDDALAAAKLLRSHKEIDPKRVFLLGHSLGGLVAPRIGQRDKDLAGLIVMAGNSRPLEDLVLEQFTYIYSLEGPLTAKQKEELADLKKKVMKVKDPKLSKETPSKDLPLGAPAVYWIALTAYNQKATAAKLKMPMFFLQGERDYQVTMDDFAGWKKALDGRKDVTFKSYPNLNHLFMAGKGKGKPAEYAQEGHVARKVVEDIAKWVKGR
jgi:dienelactone hydrolase